MDVVSGEPLFSSMDKYDPGCEWQAFTKPVNVQAVRERQDFPHFMILTEVRSIQADSYLRHVFTDWPSESGGLCCCINPAVMRFIPYEYLETEGYGSYKDLSG